MVSVVDIVGLVVVSVVDIVGSVMVSVVDIVGSVMVSVVDMVGDGGELNEQKKEEARRRDGRTSFQLTVIC